MQILQVVANHDAESFSQARPKANIPSKVKHPTCLHKYNASGVGFNVRMERNKNGTHRAGAEGFMFA